MRETVITITGNVGRKPTYFPAKEGSPAKLVTSVATSKRIRDQHTGQWRDGNTSWYDVWLSGRLAVNAAESISKGDAVIVSGSVEIRPWQDGDRQGHKAVINARAFGPDLGKHPVMIARVKVAGDSEEANAAGSTEPEYGSLDAADLDGEGNVTDLSGYIEVDEDGREVPAASGF